MSNKKKTCQGKLAGVQQALIRCEDSRALIGSLVRPFFQITILPPHGIA